MIPKVAGWYSILIKLQTRTFRRNCEWYSPPQIFHWTENDEHLILKTCCSFSFHSGNIPSNSSIANLLNRTYKKIIKTNYMKQSPWEDNIRWASKKNRPTSTEPEGYLQCSQENTYKNSQEVIMIHKGGNGIILKKNTCSNFFKL
jgi:hypothetical protein